MKKSSKEIDPEYVKKNAKKFSEKELDSIFENKNLLQEKAGKIAQLKEKFSLLFQLLKDYRTKKYTQIPWKSVAAIGFTLLYVINPLDVVPDFIPFIGYLDDASVLTIALQLVKNDLDAYALWKKNQAATE